MAARFFPECRPGEWETLANQTIPTGAGIERGEPLQLADSIVFAFGRAVPADQLTGSSATLATPDQTIATGDDIYTPVVKCPRVRITGAGSNTFNPGDSVWFDITADELQDSVTTSHLYIGKCVEAKSAVDTELVINFDGTDINRQVA